MANKDKDLPANSDVTRKDDDNRFKQQDEYATPSESEARNANDTEKMSDSQQGDERMRPESKGHIENQRPREQHPQ